MCTRYYMELSPELRPIIEEARQSSLTGKMVDKLGKSLVTEGDVRPTDMAPVIAPDKNGNRKIFPMIWGFTLPGLKRPLVNARSETAGEKTSFRDSWKRRRCIIPASWYYEWDHIVSGGKKKAGNKYAIQPAERQVTWMAGLYQIQSLNNGFRYPAFTILTRTPSPALERIHDRMPVILNDEAIDSWIFPGTAKETLKTIINESLTNLITEKAD